MNAKRVVLAIAPVVLADLALELANHSLFGEGDDSWPSWSLAAISLIVLPLWAGARVVRLGGSWPWSCLGGICVLLGTLLLAAFIDPATLEMPAEVVAGTVLALAIAYSLLAFLGGKLVGRGKAHVS